MIYTISSGIYICIAEITISIFTFLNGNNKSRNECMWMYSLVKVITTHSRMYAVSSLDNAGKQARIFISSDKDIVLLGFILPASIRLQKQFNSPMNYW